MTSGDGLRVRIAAAPPPGLGLGRTLALLLIFLAVVVGVSLFVAALLHGIFPGAAVPIVIPQVCAWVVTLMVALRWSRLEWRQVWILRPFPWRLLPALLVAALGGTVLLLEASTWIPRPAWMEDLAAAADPGTADVLLLLLSVAVVAPLAEEVMFRGALLRSYMARWSVRRSVWVSALVFAAFHLNPWQAIVALPLGLVFAWLTLRTGSLGPAIVGHAAVNFTANTLLVPIAVALGHDADSFIAADHFPPSMLALAALATLVAGLILCRQVRHLADAPSTPGSPT